MCAFDISSSVYVAAIMGFILFLYMYVNISSIFCCVGLLLKNDVRYRLFGICFIGSYLLSSSSPPSIPVIQSIPPVLSALNELFKVLGPISSSILVTPSGYNDRILSIRFSSSISVSVAPYFFSDSSFNGFLVVVIILAFVFDASCIAAIPTVLLAPRISMTSLSFNFNESNRELYAVKNVSGIALICWVLYFFMILSLILNYVRFRY